MLCHPPPSLHSSPPLSLSLYSHQRGACQLLRKRVPPTHAVTLCAGVLAALPLKGVGCVSCYARDREGNSPPFISTATYGYASVKADGGRQPQLEGPTPLFTTTPFMSGYATAGARSLLLSPSLTRLGATMLKLLRFQRRVGRAMCIATPTRTL
jgi:hypothetical protein